MFSFSKIFLSITLLACPLLNATVYLPQGFTKESIQNKTKEIAWDIHNVLAEKDGSAKAGAILGNIFPIIFTKLSGNAAWKEVDQLNKKEKDVSGEAYVRIFTKHGELSLAHMAEQAANAYKPRKGMDQLVQDIDNAGITQRLASNIGPKCFANLDAKFKSKNCYLFDKMQSGLFINYNSYGPYGPYQENLVLTTLDIIDRYHLCDKNKPHAEYFEAYNVLLNPKKDKMIIFIDDKLENIQAAVAAGMIGIHFDLKQKDLISTLRNELASLGVLTK